ncbi:helix-turn-helix transcriptional regulator [Gaoshiqia sediminis]|uniref:HTH cro/C1-type domain-containing protein n=1 Tax=Gaoshiqia sediminis TaxID=2986998 RepID=A0AA42C9M0_9BACT|nr:helix-turn-helix domain-containing protein [Gaoshiqia sediminis]MCW0484171.1 hypothetical protein [Gaoshiqia sediminis]
MNKEISIIKGIHPGIILNRELKKRKLPKKRLALLIDEFPQTIGAITKGKRRINPQLSIRIGKALGLDEEYFLILQAYHDIEQEKRKLHESLHPDLSKIRPIIFWDTDIRKIDWVKYKSSVIRRVFERGNEAEKLEIIRFYGQEDVTEILEQSGNLGHWAGVRQ